jgi:cytoskeletal protein CcmA (bactofilin family)
MAKNYEEEKNNLNIIGSGTLIKGDIETTGDIRIDGNINGNIDAKGKIVIGQIGKIEGELKCKIAEISGKIEGKITVSELLTLKSTAKIFGSIFTSKLAIEPGAIFTGSCNMGENDNTIKVVPNSDDK